MMEQLKKTYNTFQRINDMGRKYPCPLSLTSMCEYGGNKHYDSGFISGMASYCHKKKKWVAGLKNCPEQALQDTDGKDK
ncbi:hypothetical protein LCGC14_1317010 [marine sediment metagenome]|uniref:Uncharacterized protein n=1 Tax=marine sediment metagenome TaxID=412755 RepID=A0A0F9KKM0_9ZZZZ